jgi:PEP-CTERM motif
MKKITLGAIAALSSLLASVAFAGVVEPPTSLPEPGTLGLLAMGVAGIVAAARLGRRK